MIMIDNCGTVDPQLETHFMLETVEKCIFVFNYKYHATSNRQLSTAPMSPYCYREKGVLDIITPTRNTCLSKFRIFQQTFVKCFNTIFWFLERVCDIYG